MTSITKRVFYITLSLVAIHIVLYVANLTSTLEKPAKFILFKPTHSDSWTPMNLALNYFESGDREKLLYSKIFFEDKQKFLYPPTSLLSLYYFNKLFDDPRSVLLLISRLAVVSNVFLILLIFLYATKQPLNFTKGRFQVSRNSFLLLCCFGLITALYTPVMKAYNLGQVQVWLNVLFAALFYSWMRGKHASSGVILALMVTIKPIFCVLVLWGIVRKKWRFIVSFLVSLVPILLLSFYLFGFENHINYLSVLEHLSQRGEKYYTNQSMMGLLHRLWNPNVETRVFFPDSFPEYIPFVHYGSSLFALIATGFALIFPMRAKFKSSVLDLSLLAVAMTISSPISWHHHYGIVLPIFVFLFAKILIEETNPAPFKGHYMILGISYLLVSSSLRSHPYIAQHPFLNILLSWVFFGSILLIIYIGLKMFNKNYNGRNSV